MTKQEQIKTSNEAYTKARTETKTLTTSSPTKKLTALNALVFGTFGLGVILIFYFFYLLFYPFNPLQVKSVSVVTPNVTAGGTLIYKIDSCKHTNDTPQVYKKISNATTSEALPTAPGVISPGCSTKQVPVHILAGTPPGQYMLYTEVVYQVNAIRDIHVFWQAGPFSVVPQ
jgi:hypothetical protein